MKIAFFSENNTGKVPRTQPNMRTEFAWMCALNAVHYSLRDQTIFNETRVYDLGIIIIPKKGTYPWSELLRLIRSFCERVAIMQEGPNWYWQDYPIEQQFEYYNILASVDIIFAHNQSDVLYYKGHFPDKLVHVMPSLMIEDAIPPTLEKTRDVIIGGNFCSWYGGFDSYVIAKEFSDTVYAPSMGRKILGEEQIENLIHLPYLSWSEWMRELSSFKVGVHLMRTHAAGTFALNCARLGIPCIGYKGLDTQEKLHPLCTVTNMSEARQVICELRDNPHFYDQATKCQKRYYNLYTEEQFLKKFYDYCKM